VKRFVAFSSRSPRWRSGARGASARDFTVNKYAGIEVAGEDVYVRYALDVAEIPTYQLGSEIRRPAYPAALAHELVLTLDGRRVPLRVVESRATSRPCAGGLETLRLDVVYRAVGSGAELVFRHLLPRADRVARGAIGGRDGGRVTASDVPPTARPATTGRSPACSAQRLSARATIDRIGLRHHASRVSGAGVGATQALIDQAACR
jgi:hypothetical protein